MSFHSICQLLRERLSAWARSVPFLSRDAARIWAGGGIWLWAACDSNARTTRTGKLLPGDQTLPSRSGLVACGLPWVRQHKAH